MAHVLIVEDSDTVTPLEIALGSLNNLGILVAVNGRDALKLLAASYVDLAAVVTDLHLPFVDGFELIAAIRANDRYSHLPVVVVSGDDCPENRRRVRELGADAFFPKPYSPTEVRQTLEVLLHAP
ncbi:MAG: response regulator [Bryobacteraceae bacterium]